MITPIATTAPAPNNVEKMAVVTVDRSTQITIGLSPPSSTAFRIKHPQYQSLTAHVQTMRRTQRLQVHFPILLVLTGRLS